LDDNAPASDDAAAPLLLAGSAANRWYTSLSLFIAINNHLK
jgi:hypothetical protein